MFAKSLETLCKRYGRSASFYLIRWEELKLFVDDPHCSGAGIFAVLKYMNRVVWLGFEGCLI